jgi:hypothetical protein
MAAWFPTSPVAFPSCRSTNIAAPSARTPSRCVAPCPRHPSPSTARRATSVRGASCRCSRPSRARRRPAAQARRPHPCPRAAVAAAACAAASAPSRNVCDVSSARFAARGVLVLGRALWLFLRPASLRIDDPDSPIHPPTFPDGALVRASSSVRSASHPRPCTTGGGHRAWRGRRCRTPRRRRSTP